MVKAEGLSFDFVSEEHIRADLLESFSYVGEKQYITYRTEEFSAVCPFSGLPDIATVILEYIPDQLCLELKSLKYYYVSFRNVGIYQEAVTNRLFADIFAVLNPRYMKLTTVYNTRGGIDSTCFIEKGER